MARSMNIVLYGSRAAAMILPTSSTVKNQPRSHLPGTCQTTSLQVEIHARVESVFSPGSHLFRMTRLPPSRQYTRVEECATRVLERSPFTFAGSKRASVLPFRPAARFLSNTWAGATHESLWARNRAQKWVARAQHGAMPRPNRASLYVQSLLFPALTKSVR